MRQLVLLLIKDVIAQLGVQGTEFDVSVPENPDHGDYSTSVALRLSKVLKKSPMEIALQVKELLLEHRLQFTAKTQDLNTIKKDQTISRETSGNDVLQDIEKIEVVAPGFINFFVTERSLVKQLGRVLNAEKTVGTSDLHKGKTVMVEFAHPNTHKAFHIGHLRNITTGESIVRLLESTGYTVVRANYQGDVGMHIAKCLYAILHIPESKLGVRSWEEVKNLPLSKRIDYLGEKYAQGSKAYDEDEAAKGSIEEINKQIYAHDQNILDVYTATRQWSLEYFDHIYARVGSHFDRFYFESEVFEAGKKTVEDGLKKGIFEKSDGAVIFPGEKFKLHNRVFITGAGNPTYEGKEMGLGPLQFSEYHPELIIHCVGPEQAGYFQVVFEALAQLHPDTRGKEFHLIYGWVNLKHGKMSSRSGNVVLGEWLLDEAKKAIIDILNQNNSNYSEVDKNTIAEKAAIAAVKYSFLHVSTESTIAFDLATSVNMNGDSGPYLQYTYARCQSVLRKVETSGNKIPHESEVDTHAVTLEEEEVRVLQILSQFDEVVMQAASKLSPSILCTYLFRLAQQFNLFYAKHSILGIANDKNMTDQDDKKIKNFRIALTRATSIVLMRGLYLLGIEVLEQM